MRRTATPRRKYRAVAVLRNFDEWRIPLGEFEGRTRKDAFNAASNSEAADRAAATDKKTGQLYDIELELIK